MKVVPESRYPERFQQLRRVYVGEGHQPLDVRGLRRHGGRILLKLQGINSREEAMALSRSYLYVPGTETIALPPDEYFVYQIVGLRVETETGETLGTVRDVLETGSNDVYVVQGPRGEVLIPALKEVVRTLDLAAGRVVVRLPPGLLDSQSVQSSRPRRRRASPPSVPRKDSLSPPVERGPGGSQG